MSVRAQGCRPLEKEIFYRYDPSHQAYPDAATVLNVQRRGASLAIVICVTARVGTQWQITILESKDQGRHWLRERMDDVPTPLALVGNAFAQAPSDNHVLYRYSEQKAMFTRSDDGGKTWVSPQNRIDGITPGEFAQKTSGVRGYRAEFALAAVSPLSPLTLFSTIRLLKTSNVAGQATLSTSLGLYRSDNGAGSWTKVTEAIEYESPIAIDPNNPSVMFGYGMSTFLGLLRTTDGGATWNLTKQQKLLEQRPLVVQKMLGVPSGLRPQQIVIDPKATNFVYLVSAKGLYRSDNGGDTWCLLDTGTDFLDSTYSLAFDPDDTSRIFVGTRFGVLYSADRGNGFRSIYPAKH